MTRQRSATVGPASRPVAIPDDVDAPEVAKASGVVHLPQHVRWSEPDLDYDLDDREQRAEAYAQVLREGNEDDVRFYVRIEDLTDLWDELLLPEYVRTAWNAWFEER